MVNSEGGIKVRVEVNGRYAYETDMDILEVGDEVLLPSGISGDWIGQITRLSTDYCGPCKKVRGLVRKRENANKRKEHLGSIPVEGLFPGKRFPIRCGEGHSATLVVEEVNGTGRPVSVKHECGICTIRRNAGFGSANAWRCHAVDHEMRF